LNIFKELHTKRVDDSLRFTRKGDKISDIVERDRLILNLGPFRSLSVDYADTLQKEKERARLRTQFFESPRISPTDRELLKEIRYLVRKRGIFDKDQEFMKTMDSNVDFMHFSVDKSPV
jgi:hypothetical protein